MIPVVLALHSVEGRGLTILERAIQSPEELPPPESRASRESGAMPVSVDRPGRSGL
jgi:hypothetical protein